MEMFLNCDVPTEVSEEDFDFFSGFFFCVTGRGYLQCKSPPYLNQYLHIMIAKRMKLDTSVRIDHRDNNPFNNLRTNLRSSTVSQNGANSKTKKNNTHGFKGISYDKRRCKWYAKIMVGRVRMHLGSYDTPEQAHEAYCRAAKRYFGEFANSGAK